MPNPDAILYFVSSEFIFRSMHFAHISNLRKASSTETADCLEIEISSAHTSSWRDLFISYNLRKMEGKIFHKNTKAYCILSLLT